MYFDRQTPVFAGRLIGDIMGVEHPLGGVVFVWGLTDIDSDDDDPVVASGWAADVETVRLEMQTAALHFVREENRRRTEAVLAS